VTTVGLAITGSNSDRVCAAWILNCLILPAAYLPAALSGPLLVKGTKETVGFFIGRRRRRKAVGASPKKVPKWDTTMPDVVLTMVFFWGAACLLETFGRLTGAGSFVYPFIVQIGERASLLLQATVLALPACTLAAFMSSVPLLGALVIGTSVMVVVYLFLSTDAVVFDALEVLWLLLATVLFYYTGTKARSSTTERANE